VNLRRKLQNPFILVGQGFLAGALLFFAVGHKAGEARSAPPTGVALQLEAAVSR
jgi:hypothetical protein